MPVHRSCLLASGPKVGEQVSSGVLSLFPLACSLQPDGQVDYSSLHGSCPTTKGEKWSATKWIHVGAFGQSASLQRAKWWVQGLPDDTNSDNHCSGCTLRTWQDKAANVPM